jgi:CP family cyanate transporter-like MFS transporter
MGSGARADVGQAERCPPYLLPMDQRAVQAATERRVPAGASVVPPPRGLLILGIALVALNLRAAIASVGPLVADIRTDTGLSNTALGFVTTLPLLAFGVLSLLAVGVGRRLGTDRALGVALGVLGVGTLLRGARPIAALYAGTALVGVGVALANVLLPTLVKRHFPHRPGVVTSLYSSTMGLGAAAAAGLSVPIAALLGWRGALAVWVLPVAVALLAWLPQMRPTPAVGGAPSRVTIAVLGRSPLAWQVALFMGLQSLTFYVLVAWLPDLLQSRGVRETTAGGLLALSQATGIAGTLLVPVWAGASRDQRAIIGGLALLEAVGLAGLALSGVTLAWLWVSLVGFVLGGTFGLALMLLVLRSGDAETTARLSGMAQSVGYLIAATGPPVFGWLHDVTGGWRVPLGFLMAVLLAKLLAGLPAGRPGTVKA